MLVPLRRTLACAVLYVLVGSSCVARAQDPLDADGYVALVLSAHPVAGQRAGLEAAASAERQAAGEVIVTEGSFVLKSEFAKAMLAEDD